MPCASLHDAIGVTPPPSPYPHPNHVRQRHHSEGGRKEYLDREEYRTFHGRLVGVFNKGPADSRRLSVQATGSGGDGSDGDGDDKSHALTSEEADEAFEDDWEMDSGGDGRLEKEDLFDSMYQLAVQWSECHFNMQQLCSCSAKSAGTFQLAEVELPDANRERACVACGWGMGHLLPVQFHLCVSHAHTHRLQQDTWCDTVEVDEYVVYLEFLASRMFNAADKVGDEHSVGEVHCRSARVPPWAARERASEKRTGLRPSRTLAL